MHLPSNSTRKKVYLIIGVLGILCIILVGLHYQKVKKHQPIPEKEHKFKEFIIKFNRSYHNDEYARRYQNFEKSIEIIKTLNSLHICNDETNNCDSAKFGINEFSDLSQDEFKTLKLGHIKKKVSNGEGLFDHQIKFRRSKRADNVQTLDLSKFPLKWNWQDKGVVSEVRNQGVCGACWAHSVIETIESMVAIQKNRTTVEDLSVQQMIDCSRNSNRGCSGGDTCNLLEWMLFEDIGIESMKDYPLTNVEGTCATDRNKEIVKLKSFTCDNFVGREDKILSYLTSIGPVAIAVNGLIWQHYLDGIIQHHCDDSVLSLNHAVQIVGYDRSGPIPYYIVRNSWGTNFGTNGYARIEIGKNLCGIANQVSVIEVV